MALLLVRRQQRIPSNPSLIRFFSNSSSDSPPQDGNASVEKPSQSPSPADSSYSSPFADIKNRLKLKIQQQQEQGRNSFPRSDVQAQNHGSSRFTNNQSRMSPQDLGKNLANFHRRSNITPSTDSGGLPQISLESLYKQNAVPNSSDPRNRKPQDFNSSSVRENLKNLKSQTNTGVSLRTFKSTLKAMSKENVGSKVLEGDEALPMSVFGKEMNAKKGREGETEEIKTDFLKFYNEEELGDKLRMLRPEGNKEEEWFSLQELNQRLVKLRQVEEKEAQTQNGRFSVLKGFVATVKDDPDKSDAISQQNLAMFGYLGDTPEYKHYPPKEHLVETYFHPDNMSSAEKMKMELTKVREEFKMSESDCGSARVQVAQLTTKIKHLSSALHKKDKHSRKGLFGMVQKRKKLLKYLRRTDWDSYCLVLSRFGLRDNPDYKC